MRHFHAPMATDMLPSPTASEVSSDQRQAAQKKSLSHTTAWLWLAFGLVGCAVRLWLWWNSIGSYDTLLWAAHAQSIIVLGVARTYQRVPLFNHPPIMGIYAAHAWLWTHADNLKFARFM